MRLNKEQILHDIAVYEMRSHLHPDARRHNGEDSLLEFLSPDISIPHHSKAAHLADVIRLKRAAAQIFTGAINSVGTNPKIVSYEKLELDPYGHTYSIGGLNLMFGSPDERNDWNLSVLGELFPDVETLLTICREGTAALMLLRNGRAIHTTREKRLRHLTRREMRIATYALGQFKDAF